MCQSLLESRRKVLLFIIGNTKRQTWNGKEFRNMLKFSLLSTRTDSKNRISCPLHPRSCLPHSVLFTWSAGCCHLVISMAPHTRDLSTDFHALVLALLLNSPFPILAWARALVVQDWMKKKIAKSLSQKPTELIRNSKRQNSASDRHQLKLRSSVNFRGLKISPNNLLISMTLPVLNPLVWYLLVLVFKRCF